MSNINNLIDNYESSKPSYDRFATNERLKAVSKLLIEKRFSRWSFAFANFGENFQWIQNDTSHETFHTVQHQKYFTYQDVEAFKGINYGQFEFGARHFCLILKQIFNNSKTVLVMPMTSIKDIKQTPKKTDIILSPERYTFLTHSTALHTDRMIEIGLERFETKFMSKTMLQPNGFSFNLSQEQIIELKNKIKKSFDIRD